MVKSLLFSNLFLAVVHPLLQISGFGKTGTVAMVFATLVNLVLAGTAIFGILSLPKNLERGVVVIVLVLITKQLEFATQNESF